MKSKTMIDDLTASEIMTEHVETLMPSDTVKDALLLMLDGHLTTIPIVNAENHCVGMLSRSDLTEMLAKEDNELTHARDGDRESLYWLSQSIDTGDVRKVSEFMVIEVQSASRGDSLTEICKLMHQHHIHHVPVLDEQTKLVGIVSAFDVVKAIATASAD